ncbi:MAG: DMT family transporter [Bacillaceae bacterium]
MGNSRWIGHVFAFITIFIWGTTYISTKVLFDAFTPEEIIMYRFAIAFIILLVLYPKGLKPLPFKQEFLFFLLGLFGVTFYFLLENWALKFTYASNVSLYAAAIPLFTAIIAHFTTKDEKFTLNFLLGFIMAMIGIFLIIYNGKVMELNLLGDALALLAAVVFAVYNVLIRKLDTSYNNLFVVRRTFFYGIVTMIPFMFTTNTGFFKMENINTGVILNLLFLAILASLLCYVMWNHAIAVIGSIKTSNYIYFMPLVTIVTSIIFLDEKVSFLMLLGGFLIIFGVYMNESKRVQVLMKKRVDSYKKIS